MGIPRWMWWVAGGAGLLALANQGKAQAERLGDLVVRVAFKPGTMSLPAVNAVLNALLGARSTVCPTFPAVVPVTICSGPEIPPHRRQFVR